jgi:hypothetical protein
MGGYILTLRAVSNPPLGVYTQQTTKTMTYFSTFWSPQVPIVGGGLSLGFPSGISLFKKLYLKFSREFEIKETKFV